MCSRFAFVRNFKIAFRDLAAAVTQLDWTLPHILKRGNTMNRRNSASIFIPPKATSLEIIDGLAVFERIHK